MSALLPFRRAHLRTVATRTGLAGAELAHDATYAREAQVVAVDDSAGSLMATRRAVLAGATGATVGAMLPRHAYAVTSPVLLVAAHPDDETLAMGVTIAEHAGQDVHVLLLTRGTTSSIRETINGTSGPSSWWGVMHNPAAEGFAPLDKAAFGRARLNEARTALRCLSASPVTVHEAGLLDGAVTQAGARAAILAVADLIAPAAPVRLKTHTHIVDNHPDHLAAGAAARQLRISKPTRFGDLRHHIRPAYWADPRLSQVVEVWDMPANAAIAARVVNAGRAYGAWAPPHSYAIGHHSSGMMFAQLMGSPRCLFHQ